MVNKIRATYNHALYVEQRQRMMQDWADQLDQWERGEKGIVAAPAPNLSGELDMIAEYLKRLSAGGSPQLGGALGAHPMMAPRNSDINSIDGAPFMITPLNGYFPLSF